jgi:flavin reductase (DIM6/NTAB) family NADH-FMN oxidoreductase RutF
MAISMEPRELRNIFGTFATGVTVITMPTKDGGAWGMTANSLTSLSLDPPLILVCIDKSTRTHQHMLDSGVWAVNILAGDQEKVSRIFAMKDQNEERAMTATPYHIGKIGAPIVEGCLSYLECRTYATYDGGDHTIVVGEIEDASVAQPDGQPLLFYKGRYGSLADPPPTA